MGPFVLLSLLAAAPTVSLNGASSCAPREVLRQHRPERVHVGNMVDDDCDGQVDEGCNTVDAGVDAGIDVPDCMGTTCVNGVCQ